MCNCPVYESEDEGAEYYQQKMHTAECDIAKAIEESRMLFEEKAWMAYTLHCNSQNWEQAFQYEHNENMTREQFLKRRAAGDYLTEGLEVLWQGWQWCYSICKIHR
jgi:hypothetical protein